MGRTQDSLSTWVPLSHIHRDLVKINPAPSVDEIDAEKVQDEAPKDVICKCSEFCTIVMTRRGLVSHHGSKIVHRLIDKSYSR